MSLKRHLLWLTAALAFGALVLPFLVYYTGTATLGPYARGGAGSFVLDWLGGLARLEAQAWVLLLGPAAVVLGWRLLVAWLWPVEQR